MALASKIPKTTRTVKQPVKQKDLSPLVESLSKKIENLEQKVSSQTRVIEKLQTQMKEPIVKDQDPHDSIHDPRVDSIIRAFQACSKRQHKSMWSILKQFKVIE